MNGPLLFARFAYPPNALGYCGPEAGGELLDYADGAPLDARLRDLDLAFEGARPYLELLAGANGIADPLDGRVVEAYWIGNRLLDGITPRQLGNSLDERFRPAAGRDWDRLVDVVEHEARPDHLFHVFCVYPWVGLLRSRATDHALHVLDRCRIRVGRVRSIDGATAVVVSSQLTWDGRRLGLAPPADEVVAVADGERWLAPGLAAGDLVACHWGWACHRLTPRQARRLVHETTARLDLVNRRLRIPPPAAVLA